QACDHLEEQMIPVHAWGTRYVGARASADANWPNVWRVLAHADNTVVDVRPPPGKDWQPRTLSAGEWFDFKLGDAEVTATNPVLVTEFMVGMKYCLIPPWCSPPNPDTPGDPAMSLIVPVEQYRTEYSFLAPETYEESYVSIIAPPDITLTLDGNRITPQFTAIGKDGNQVTDYQIAKLPISGSHTLKGSTKFGILVYGMGSYTSYMYPGGLDVKVIYPQ
ncbi:MAG: IgGFc-binding protein, partial [Pseudomonadota bacterium]